MTVCCRIFCGSRRARRLTVNEPLSEQEQEARGCAKGYQYLERSTSRGVITDPADVSGLGGLTLTSPTLRGTIRPATWRRD
jgi:hypothetical protein